MYCSRLVALLLTLIACSLPQPLAAAKDVLASKKLSFEPNRGQTAAEVEFVSRGKRSSLFLTRGKAVLSLVRGERQLALAMRFVNANPNPAIEGANRLPGTANYFLGSDPRQWRTSIPLYGRVLYHGLYRGIDLAYYGTDRQLEYDFVVSPGADPRAIRLEFAGHDTARIDRNGDLLLMAGGYELRQHKPVVYQEADGRRESIDGRYVLRGRTVSFDVGPYDRRRTLVIDPLLGYSSYLGGGNEEDAAGVATDVASNVYVTGSTLSPDFPISPGTVAGGTPSGSKRIVYVTKIEPDSETLVYSALVGPGTTAGIAADADGNAYITGVPNADFPATYDPVGGTASGAFVAKLNGDGTKVVYSVLFHAGTAPRGIVVDRNGAAYICGTVAGKTLRTTPGVIQPTFPGTASSTGFVAKVNPDGKSLGFVTHLGSPGSGTGVVLNALAADSSGNVYITGNTRAADLPVTGNAPQPKIGGAVDDAFVFKLNAAASTVLFGTYLGGIGADWGYGIGLDGANNIFVAGWTSGGAFPTTTGAYISAVSAFGGAGWVVKYSPDYKVLFSSYIADLSSVRGLAVDAAGNTYTAGEAAFTSTLRATPDAIKSKVDRAADGAQAWVAKLDPTGTRLIYGTYFGGSEDEAVAGVAVDPDASIYIAGETSSPDVPVSFNPVQKTHNANLQYKDAYVTQFAEPPWFDADHIANGASFQSGAIAPGEIITIYGFSLGPKKLRTYNLTNGKFDTTLARTRVLFDGVEAPIIYASWGQTSIVVPYSVRGKQTTQAVVEYKGRRSAPVTLTVADAAPGIFTLAQSGSGQGAILNQDYSVNGPNTRIARGQVLMVFLTVGGENGKDGELAQGIQQHPMNVTARVGGVDAQAIYAGPSPGLIWGLTQVNVIVPADAPSGAAVPIMITFGNRSTQAGVTIAVK
jgi:uncharacterized protein (TIGR03437 family)